MSTQALRVVIVEDEELQRRQVEHWLADGSVGVVVGQASSGLEALDLIDSLRPDVVLLDVSLPELSGLEVLARIQHSPEIVFTTAARDHAIRAFELGAAEYLLKPFGAERLLSALQRVKSRLAEPESTIGAEPRLSERVASVRNEQEPLARLFVRDRHAIVPIAIETIVRLESDGDYTGVIAGGRRHLISVPLQALHERIGRADFVRVHRQHVVNLAYVKRFTAHDPGRLRIELANGDSILASRAGSQAIRTLTE